MIRIFFLISLMVVYLSWIVLKQQVATDLGYVSTEDLNIQFQLPQVWVSNGNFALGEYFIWGLSSWPLNFIYGVLSNFGVSFYSMIKFFWLLPFLSIGFWGIYKLLIFEGIRKEVAYVGSFLYLSNSYILMVIDGGQLNLALAYSLLPVTLYYLQKLLKELTRLNFFVFNLLILGISVSDFRFLYLFVVLCLLIFIPQLLLFERDYRKVSKLFIYGLTSLLLIVGVHSYWILPSILSRFHAPNIGISSTQVLDFSSARIGHALLLQHPNWHLNLFGKISQLKVEFLLIPALALLAPSLKSKDRTIAKWMLVLIVGIFLTKGVNPPFGEIYSYLYDYLPGFNLFRDSTKFFFLICLSYSFLISLTVDRIQSLKLNLLYPIIAKLLPILVITFFVFQASPLYLNKTTGLFNRPIFEDEYQRLNNSIQGIEGYSKIVWIPIKPSLGYSSPNHPAVDASRILDKRPFAAGAVGRYESLNFFREAAYMGEILNILGVSHLVYPPLDFRKQDMGSDAVAYHKLFLSQLVALPWVNGLEDSPIPLIKLREHQDLFFLSHNIWGVVGSDQIYNEATKSSKLSLPNNTLVFLEESPEVIDTIRDIPGLKIVLYLKTSLDLQMSLLRADELIFPASWLTKAPNNNGWWKRDSSELIDLREYLLIKYQINNHDFDLKGGWAISEEEGSLDVDHKSIRSESEVFIRLLESPKGGNLQMYQGNELVSDIDTRASKPNLRWVRAGTLKNNNKISLKPSGEINVINAVAVIDPERLNQLEEHLGSIKSKITDYVGESVVTQQSRVEYQEISSTKYKVTVAGLSSPSMLIFSQNFNDLWRLDDKAPISVYSFLNGFLIKGDGEYILEYLPQKYVEQGLYISGLSVILFIALGFYIIKR